MPSEYPLNDGPEGSDLVNNHSIRRASPFNSNEYPLNQSPKGYQFSEYPLNDGPEGLQLVNIHSNSLNI